MADHAASSKPCLEIVNYFHPRTHLPQPYSIRNPPRWQQTYTPSLLYKLMAITKFTPTAQTKDQQRNYRKKCLLITREQLDKVMYDVRALADVAYSRKSTYGKHQRKHDMKIIELYGMLHKVDVEIHEINREKKKKKWAEYMAEREAAKRKKVQEDMKREREEFWRQLMDYERKREKAKREAKELWRRRKEDILFWVTEPGCIWLPVAGFLYTVGG